MKKIFLNNVDEDAHRQFVRFGKGSYGGRAALSLMKTSKVKLRGSFEYANDFVDVVSELANAKFSGIVMSKKELDLGNSKKKAGLNVYEVSDIDSVKIKQIRDRAYFMLLDAEGPGLSLRMKKKLPKPGKSGDAKIDDGFCVLEADLRYWNKIKEGFLWDLPECKKAKISHVYEITSLEMPKGEKDFEKIRLMTKRKGKIKRKIEVDGQSREADRDFEA